MAEGGSIPHVSMHYQPTDFPETQLQSPLGGTSHFSNPPTLPIQPDDPNDDVLGIVYRLKCGYSDCDCYAICHTKHSAKRAEGNMMSKVYSGKSSQKFKQHFEIFHPGNPPRLVFAGVLAYETDSIKRQEMRSAFKLEYQTSRFGFDTFSN